MAANSQEENELATNSVPELIELALTHDPEGEYYWEVVWALRERATTVTFEAARALCRSADSRRRALGVNILAQLGVSQKSPRLPFKEETLALLLPMFDDPRNSELELLGSLIAALGHQHDLRTVSTLIRFKNHPNANLRWSVAVALGGLEDDTAIATLIEMSRDAVPEVRDWATFGLGAQSEADTPAIRAALFRRLNDSDDDTRNEAIRGLAERDDPRVIEPLLKELATAKPHGLAIEAADILAGQGVLPDWKGKKIPDKTARLN